MARKPQTLTFEEIAESAAHLVAVLHDDTFGVSTHFMSAEARDSLEILEMELEAIGLLKEYRRKDGTLGI